MSPAAPRLVLLDTETTGLDPSTDRIIDLGAVLLDESLEIVASFSEIVDPGRPIPLMIQRMVGIGPAEVAGAAPFAEVYRRFLAFAGDAPVAGQNIAFDIAMIESEAARAGLPGPPPAVFDTLEAALLLYPELDRHNLHDMSVRLGFAPQEHRALPDARDTAGLLRALAGRAAELPDPERRLLDAVRWRPLEFLRHYRLAPQSRTPELVPPSPELTGSDPRSADRPAILGGDADGWRAALRPDGPLAEAIPGFTRRPGQSDLAEAIAGILGGGGIGLYEAGTGMGKSLAYLLPAAHHGAARGRRVVVSTKTKALQRQLAERELPAVSACLAPGWRWAVLMGRENYLCRRRLDDALAEAGRTLPDADRVLALAYLVGRSRRGQVDLSALPFRALKVLPALASLARELRSSQATCLGRRCGARTRCHWQLARARAAEAHLVVVNHALLLVGGDTLPSFEDLIVDEAHLLPDEAVSAFSERVDRSSLGDLLLDIRGRRGQRSLATIVAAAARQAEPAVAPSLDRAAAGIGRAADEIPALVDDVGAALAALVADVAGSGDADEGSPGDAGYATSLLLTPGLQERPAFDHFAVAAAALAADLVALAQAAGLAAEALPEDHREHPRAVTLGADASAAAALLHDLTGSLPPDLVGWAELQATIDGAAEARRRPEPATVGPPPAQAWSLSRAPLSPAPLIRERLWERLRSAVLTSATLGVAGSFSYFSSQAGLSADLDVDERVFASPFDYSRQAALVLEHDPGTAFSHAALPGRQAERLQRLVEVTGGRLLALFTNKRHLQQVAAQVGARAEDGGVLVLAQGVHGSAAALAEEFRTQPSTVLLGVDALWTGQDFPGDALVCLVIAKLPFPRQDAVFRARRRAAELEGRDWFRSFYLPETVLRFRQGFGRLIRTEADRGVVAVLDPRLAQKSYRSDFIASLPELQVVEASPDELPDVVGELLTRLGALPGD